MKVIDINNRNYQIVYDIELPITKFSNLIWIGFSEEGMLYTYDNEGVLRTLNPFNKQWVPVLDFKYILPDSYGQYLWIVGVSANEVLVIEMPKNYEAPLPS